MAADARWAWAEIDLEAIRHNVAHIREVVAPSAVWAVVKADGYGHGAVDVARAAIDAGAEGLCVALVGEGIELRDAGIDASILLLSEPPPETAPLVVRYRLTPTVYTERFVEALVDERPAGMPVHLKIDTGMQRVGVQPEAAAAFARLIEERSSHVRLAGVYTHPALADDPDDPATAEQLDRFADAVSVIPDGPMLHAANSAGALAHPAARMSLVRVGIAMYGLSPGRGVDHLCTELRPALELRARVSFVKQVRAGSRVSYGLRHTFERDSMLATIPLGYADGVPRRLSSTGGEVLIRGVRRPIVGVVTMDQLMVDCGEDDVQPGDDVVLIGSQDGPLGSQQITAREWADSVETISYEIVCGISERVPRIPRRSIDS